MNNHFIKAMIGIVGLSESEERARLVQAPVQDLPPNLTRERSF